MLYESKYIRKVIQIEVNVVLSIWSFRTAGSQIDRSPDIAIIVVRFAISFGNSDIDPDCLKTIYYDSRFELETKLPDIVTVSCYNFTIL